jgi:hypothetical protein
MWKKKVSVQELGPVEDVDNYEVLIFGGHLHLSLEACMHVQRHARAEV